MLRPLLALITVWTVLVTAAYAKDDCYSCHGKKGARGYIDVASYEQSVHNLLECTKCHLGISGYPHGKVARVNCGICHFLGREGAPQEQAQQYKLSVHGRAALAGNAAAPTCQTCHGSHYIYRSTEARSMTNRERVPALCSSCHPKEFADYRMSIHGREFLEKKNLVAANCFDCHLEHLTPNPGDDQFKLLLVRQCGLCHADEMSSYRKTYHGKVTRLGYANIAKCSDCHGAHTILPPADQGSMLSQKNIVATCRACHPRATEGFTKYYAHAEESNRAKYPVLYYTYLFMTMLLIGVFAFFFTHTFLWAFRALKERLEKKGGG
jgi:5-methylcytosine-specific restriction endonuclease McrA